MGGLLWWEGVRQAVGSLTGLPSVIPLLVTHGLSCHCPPSNEEQWGNPWGLGRGCPWQQPGDHWMGQEGRKLAGLVGGKEAQ